MSTTARITVLTASAVSGCVLGLGAYHAVAEPSAGAPGTAGETSPPVLTVHAPCTAPAQLQDGVCVTTVHRTRVVTEQAPATATEPATATTATDPGGVATEDRAWDDDGVEDAERDDHDGDEHHDGEAEHEESEAEHG